MRKISFALLSFVFAAFVFFAACSKSDDSSTPSKKENLCGKNWIMSAATTLQNGLTINIFQSLPKCFVDDILNFDINGKFIKDNNVEKCQVSESQTESGTWTFSEDEKILIITISNGANSETLKFNVIDISASTLEFTMTMQGTDGNDYVVTMTFKVK